MNCSLCQRPGFLSAAAGLLFLLIAEVSVASCTDIANSIPKLSPRPTYAEALAACQKTVEYLDCAGGPVHSYSCRTQPWDIPHPDGSHWGVIWIYDTYFAWPNGTPTAAYLEYVITEKKYTVKLARADGLPSDSATMLVSSEPGKVPPTLVATVTDDNGQVVPNVAVQVEVNAVPNSGGHSHGDDSSPLRTGTLTSADPSATPSHNNQVLSGNTGASGFAFSFVSPGVSGDITITATCTGNSNCIQSGPTQVWVGYRGLLVRAPRDTYILITPNADGGHPNNHYFTSIAGAIVTVFADLYHENYPNRAVLQLNDSSLERGGIFDLRHNWKIPHKQHCRGAAVDIRANGADGALNITSTADPIIKKIQQIGTKVGAEARFEVPRVAGVPVWERRHFHTRLIPLAEDYQCP